MENSVYYNSFENGLFVPETAFGFWFLGTHTWQKEVIRVAIQDLNQLIAQRQDSYPTIVDVGCGHGLSFIPLIENYKPNKIIAVDYETKALTEAKQQKLNSGVEIEFLQNDCAALEIADASVDMIFCHQTFHHLVQQENALAEFFRVLKPGGILLFAESTKAYIHSWIIRLLFAHPMDKQRTATEYQQMLKTVGFKFGKQNTSFPYLWWSRSDLGLLELMGIKPKPFGLREETLLNLVATKPRV